MRIAELRFHFQNGNQSVITNTTDNYFFFLIISEWLVETGHRHMSKDVLADTLRLFYPSVRQKGTNDFDEPKPYAKQSLINIQSSVNRNLHLPPYNKNWDLMHDSEFLSANLVFSGM